MLDLVASCFTFALTGPAAPALEAIVVLQVGTLVWAGLRQRFAGRQYLILVMGAMIWWSIAGIAELSSTSAACKIAWATSAWPGIGLLPPAWLVFVLRFSTGSTRPVARNEVLFLAGTALGISSLAFTNAWHGLFYRDAVLMEGPQGAAFIQYVHGPLFYLTVLGLYAVMLAAFVRVLSCALSAGLAYRKYYVLLSVAAAVPLVGNAAYVALGVTIFGLDPTPFLFTISSLLLIAHVVSGEFFDYHSLGQKLIVESMKTPAILLAGDGQIFALNGSARTMVAAGEIDELALQPMTGHPGQPGAGADDGAVAIGNRWLRMEVIPVPAARAPRVQPERGAKVVLLHDITLAHQHALELKRAVEEQAENMRRIRKSRDVYLEQATRDALTGLLNRRSLDASFAAMKEQALSRGGPVTIAMVDLDDFKTINDRFGHANGDRALQTFADGLRAVCREEDRIYRLGGDEFLILTISMPQDVLEARLRDMGDGPQFLPETAALNAVKVGFSFGTASARIDVSLDELIASADRTLYARKTRRVRADEALSCVSEIVSIL